MLLTIWLLAGCREQPSAQLQTLYTMTSTCPDSALSLLQKERQRGALSIPDKFLSDLITIKAKDKTNQSIVSDSTILDVVTYYEDGKNDILLSEAYYYAGRFYAERKDFSRAMEYFYKCDESIANNKRYLKLQCVLNSQIGYIFRSQLLSRKSLPYFRKSFNLSVLTNDTLLMANSLRDIGVSYGFCGQEDSALHYCLKAYQLSKKTSNHKLFVGMNTQVARCYNEMGRYAEAEPYIVYALNHFYKEKEKPIYANAAATYLGLSQYDKAKKYLHAMEKLPGSSTSDYIPQHLAYIAIKQDSLKLANHYLDIFLKNYDIARQQREQEASAVAKAAYDYSSLEREKVRVEHLNLLQKGGLIALFVLLVGTCCYGYAYYSVIKQKRKFFRLKLRTYQERLLFLEQEKESKGGNADTAILRETFFPNNAHGKLSIEKWNELMLQFNQVEPQFKNRVLELCEMDDRAFRMCLLIKLGLSPTAIAHIMCISTSAISNQRKRLYYRAFGKNGNPNDWDEIIRKL